MFSKFRPSIVIAFVAVASLVGCSEFFDGKKQAPEVIELANDRFSCLSDLPENMKQFSIGEASEVQIASGVTCLQGALTDFQKKTKGSVDGGYTIEDMRKFFGKYFLKKNNVTPQFAAELMKIKQALLGGSSKSITKDEILRLVDLFEILKEEFIAINPHIKILLTQNTNKKISYEQVSSAIESLRRSLQRVLVSTQLSKSEYSFEDAKKTLSGFSEFIRGTESFAPYERYSDWLPLIESVKRVLMGEQAQFVSQKAWSRALDNIIDLYELALKYHYVIQDFHVGNKAELRQVTEFLSQALSLIENSHQMRTSERILFSDIDALLEQVFQRVKTEIHMTSVKELYQVVVLKMLEPQRLGDSRGLQALKLEHMRALRREFNIWRFGQAFVDHLPFSENQKVFSHEALKGYAQRFNAGKIIDTAFPGSSLEQAALNHAWSDLEFFIQRPTLMNFNEQGKMWSVYNSAMYGYSWASLTKFNLMKTLGRLLMIGYGKNVSGSMTAATLSEQGLVAWYSDFRNIGIDLKAFDRRKGNSGSRSFMEANFFTAAGDGDDVMNIAETTEFVGLLFSAGLGTSSTVQKSLTQERCEASEEDVFGFKLFDEQCFKSALRKNFASYFNNLPWMAKEVAGFSDSQWNEFYESLLVSSRVEQPLQGRIEMSEIRAMVTVLHYIENIVTLYDKDQNGGLSLEEVRSAFPRFKCFFQAVKPGYYDFILEEGFASLVFFGTMPEAWDLVSFQGSKIWGLDDARRTNLLKILQVLKTQMATPQKKSTPLKCSAN
jgi:plasmid maintenance system antidote protein VapI